MTSLRERYAGLVCDLDGVVYRGPEPVPHAVEAISVPGTRVVYATNNASRPPDDVAAHLRRLGLDVGPEHVVTSSQAGARRLAAHLAPGAPVLAVGGPGVGQALTEAGLEAVTPQQLRDRTAQGGSVAVPAAVLQGYGAGVTADDLAWASYLVADGAPWVATNTDATLPTDRGVAPGNGMLVAAVQRASGVTPESAGKPAGDLYDLACDRLGTREVLGVGDRLDTDILGAMAAGLDSLWVLTGVDDLTSLVRAEGRPRPTYVASDLRVLDHPVPSVSRAGEVWVCDGWSVERVRAAEGRSEVTVRREGAAGTGVGRENAVLNAGMHLLIAALDQRDRESRDRASSGGLDRVGGEVGAEAPDVHDTLVDLARSVTAQAGLRGSHGGD